MVSNVGVVSNVSVSVFSGGGLLSMGAGNRYESTWGWVGGCACSCD